MTSPAPVSHAQAVAEVWTCQRCGEGLDGACGTLTPQCRLDAELVVARLEAAGSTLLAMRGRSPWPAQYRCALPESVQLVVEAYGYTPSEIRPALPDAAAITRMDAVFRWLQLVPNHRYVLRRIVAARALVHPLTGKHLLSWRRLGAVIRADHHAAMRWHSQGIDLIVDALR